ncbi:MULTISPECIES: NAD(P)H-hydrate dehydratase [Pontibacillus]|uniref:Bifunctional NAD(P)H-hydrate repair enzyme n=1 Tax=Pontibacillus chungwhensis TaxID=265426 RepID=A0ABY8UYM7_9BACI|nr:MULTISPECIES: NAD(P)H-hydrate dehydratase [Pontibacillus]MCD5325848.1 NAD(P)H-hydrate dehydratase [Pontibacillus sp. HN14]WIF98378.1 NAD(P)H-hydrate dehydratase [Pontibacillus chungwhensis]
MHIVTAKEMYDTDRYAMEEMGLQGHLLMENAGRAVATAIKDQVSEEDQILILVGKGNNGGDGFVIARTLLQQGYSVEVLQIPNDEEVQGDARTHREIYEAFGYGYRRFDSVDSLATLSSRKTVIIDCLLGIGVKGPLRSPYDEIVPHVNQLDAKVISVDLPSGVPADEGVSFEGAIQADYTVVIQYPKTSAFLQHTAPYYGDWKAVDIGLPDHLLRGRNKGCSVWTKSDVVASLPEREPFSHKGSHGKGLVIGGSIQMPGSVTMTSRAALRAGAGLLTVATVSKVISILASSVTEATFIPLEEQEGRISSVEGIEFGYDGVAIGMGMGRHREGKELLEKVLKLSESPVLIDADGLYALKGYLSEVKSRSYPTIITPHPGEMAHLLDVSIPELLEKPFHYSRQFASRYGVHVVLKGAFTLVTTPDEKQWVHTTGNVGLAKGGSGDVLAGMLLAMVMQPQTVELALNNGVWLHGSTADLLTEQAHSTYDLLATDLIDGLSKTYRTI